MTEVYLWLTAIFITLLFVAFFAGIETAFISANRLGIELKKKQGKASGIIMSRFMEEPSRFLGTCIIGFNIFLVIYGLLFSELMKASLWNPFHIESEYLKLALDTLISAIIVLILGVFLPKAIFRAKSDSLLAFFAPMSGFFHDLFPFI